MESLPCVCTRQRNIWSLCRVHTHGKDTTWRTPVHRGGWMVCQAGLCHACWFTAHGKEAGTTHGKVLRTATSEHTAASQHTAARTTHGRGTAHGNGHDTRQRRRARQRSGTHGNVLPARQRSLPSLLRETHGNVFVAGHDFAVPPLPCVDARQCRCRAF
jgi:hypothetical protein